MHDVHAKYFAGLLSEIPSLVSFVLLISCFFLIKFTLVAKQTSVESIYSY